MTELRSRIESSPLYNEDLAPASAERRHWGTYNFAALWISMSVNILTYMLAASLIQGGMNWKQAVATIFIGNVIVLGPMLLNSHPGAKYEFLSPFWLAHPSECWVRISPRCCARWSPVDGSAFKRGLAAKRSALCSQRWLPAGKTSPMGRRSAFLFSG